MKTTGSLSKTFKKTALFPLGIIVIHVLLMLSGMVFTKEGGWLVLYTLLLICVPLIVLLYAIGWILAKREKLAEGHGA